MTKDKRSPNFLLSGYYGYDNAGDEAVLAAILEALAERAPSGTTYTVTAGDPTRTKQVHDAPNHPVQAIGRQNISELANAIKSCDVFISGGGSLLQDVTSLRNVVYYTTLIRWAQLARKPVMIYAQGVGPLRHSISRKLARAVMQRARVITLRDGDSRDLLHSIGVRRKIEVTADPVWALKPAEVQDRTSGPVWCLGLRPWPSSAGETAPAPAHFGRVLREAARAAGAELRFLPMQPHIDTPFAEAAGARPEEIINTENMAPCAIMGESGRCDVMIAMRLHALIFAAAQGVPCVAINYDPKVAALANIIGAPLLENLGESEMARLPAAVEAARLVSSDVLRALQDKARSNAELAVGLFGQRKM